MYNITVKPLLSIVDIYEEFQNAHFREVLLEKKVQITHKKIGYIFLRNKIDHLSLSVFL